MAVVVSGGGSVGGARGKKPKAPAKPKKPPKNPYAYSPFVDKHLTAPPSGSYDPSLDAQARNAQQGYEDLVTQSQLTTEPRAQEDYQLARGNTTRNQEQGLADMMLARTRASEDHTTALANLNRRFADQSINQTQAARVRGVDEGGTLAASAAARGSQQTLAVQPIETNFARFNETSAIREQRLRDATARALGQLGIGYQRGTSDRSLALSKAGITNIQFQQDIGKSKWYQAAQGGYVAPHAPANEKKAPNGQVYREAKIGSRKVYVLPNGSILAGIPGQKGSSWQVDPKTNKRFAFVKGKKVVR